MFIDLKLKENESNIKLFLTFSLNSGPRWLLKVKDSDARIIFFVVFTMISGPWSSLKGKEKQ